MDYGTGEAEAFLMLETFASTGAETFNLTLTNLNGEKVAFRRAVPLDQLRREMPTLLVRCERLQRNVIVRPNSGQSAFIQLDDLKPPAMQRVQPISFLQLATSSGNGQAWIALPAQDSDEDLARRVRKGAGADEMASGATRIAGSINFKPKYAPDFPRVEIAHSAPGLLTSRAELDRRGLIAQAAAPKPYASIAPRFNSPKAWPDYSQVLDGAPPNHDKTGPDRSKADFTWCMTAIRWGWSIEEVAAKLMEYSGKAQERKHGQQYAENTARSAAKAVERNRSRSRG